MREQFFTPDGDIYRVNLFDAHDQDLRAISREMGLALSLDEMRRIRDYFAAQGRQPTDLELQALGQAWSEHCCYKSSKPVLRQNIYGIEEERIAAREDAGVMEFDDDHYYVAALESHNHPSAIEPYGGAATGIGGIVRDVLCMGAQPIALIDPLFFGRLDFDVRQLPRGVKHPRYLFQRVVEGIRDYGNRIGIPTVAGQVYFHNGYVGNCLVNVGCLGIVDKQHLIHSRVKRPGDVYIYAGGRTGRDGIHGVTFASEELTEESEEESISAVQLGDPITKEPLIHACLECVEADLVEGMKDLGGGGLSCVCGELAYDAGFGAEVHLDRVPLKAPDMAPWEIWVSESQERMMLVVRPENVDRVLDIFARWDVTAVTVGKSIQEPLVRVWWHHRLAGELDLRFQVGGPVYERPLEEPPSREGPDPELDLPDVEQVLLSVLASSNVCSREWVIRQYDFEVRGSTPLKPLQGPVGRQTHGDAAVVKPLPGSYRGLAITADVNPAYMLIHPYLGARAAVDEVCRNLVAVGARPDSIGDCLNFGNPEKPRRMGELHLATRGLAEMARALRLPFISGNVSLYNETAEGAVPPTPTLMGMGIVPDIRRCISTPFKREGDSIYLVGQTERELGGSEYYQALGVSGGKVPRTHPERLSRYMDALLQAVQEGWVNACHDVSGGGLGVCLAEMAMGGTGAEVCLYQLGEERVDVKLFSESATRWVVEVGEGREEGFEELMGELAAVKVGTVTGDRLTIYDGRDMHRHVDLSAARLWETWSRPLWDIMG
ncbi:MAG: phosphoribosylformylglycinamidine synthase subunit PurL [Candidatus Thermoplasmatota archaeon]|nr:phosphoribosylformylglycinamidine synthase subunit PurL [Candidatus Thermoplasmatota archaeon]